MNALRLIILILANYRLSRVISEDAIALEVRQAFGRRAAKAGKGSFAWYVAEWVNCPYCQGVWFAAVLAIFAKPKSLTEYVLAWWAIAGGQCFLEGQSQ